ncbi:MAG TPA: glycosyltransferase family A protein [Bryobacteraceae bacterium]|nr:glycosyltransferase family A protein [Bryobacteraceae bacterium]
MNPSAEARHSDTAPVTAIIPTYNRANYLGEALASILGQTSPPTQVIVVDDGSTDGTRDVVAGFGPAVEYVAKPNGGKSSALNLGLQHAIGELIWIFDDDDIAEPDALVKLVRALADNPHCGFAFGEFDIFTTAENGRTQMSRASFPDVNPEDLYLALMERSFILQQGLLVRRSCYDVVGDFDETLIRSQDLDMMLRLARRYQGVKVEGILFHLRQHAGIRGSGTSPLLAARVVDGWVKSDRKIMGEIYATHDLRDFLPAGSYTAELTERQKLTALLQRSCIMARKGMWHQAAQDLSRAGEVARTAGNTKLTEDQTSILHRVFDLFSYAPHTFASSAEFQRALNEMKPAQLRRRMRASILWSLPFTIGAVLLHRQYANFWKFLRAYFVLATPDAVLRTVFTRSFFHAGMNLVRSRRVSNVASGRHTRSAASIPAA